MRMKTARFSLPALLLGATLVFASCGDPGPTGPATPRVGAPQADLLGGTIDLTTSSLQSLGLLKCSPLPYATATKVIGPAGGTINVGPHSFTVPPFALSRWVTITATAPSDKVNRVVFSPDGLQFQRSASLTMSYRNCNVLGSLVPKHIAYVDDDLRILYYLLSVDDLLDQKVTGKVDHFSDYAMAW
jgi:hypothetical protein